MSTKKIELLGVNIDCLTLEQTVCVVDQIIRDRKPSQHVVVNALKFAMMNGDSEIRRIVNSCDIVNADGLPVVWASRLLGKSLPERVAGIDLFNRLVKHSADKGYRPFFLGAREEIVRSVVEKFNEKYPSLKIAGFRNGYFQESEEQEIAESVRNSHADLLFVGISSPKKEKFLNKWIDYMQVPFCMGVGGSFDIAAGMTKRAPEWMQNNGLEWLYRVVQEPRRMWWRYTKTNSIFIWMVLKEYLKTKSNKNRTE